jgi:hypothetical protein
MITGLVAILLLTTACGGAGSTTQDGTAPVGSNAAFGQVTINRVTYLGTGGTLTLTATGEKFSGQFAFTAGNTQDESKTIQVTGTLVDVPLQK